MKIFFTALFLLSISIVAAQTDSAAGELKVEPPMRSVKEAAITYDVDDAEKKDSWASKKTKKGTLKVVQDKNIDVLVKNYSEEKKFTGYRIQLFAGNSKVEAVKVKSDFISKFENNYPEVIYQVPNFKVRVGNFRDRLEATKMLEIYKAEYPYAFIVQDNIEFKK
ncbi:MAG: SPOR domain-containing protein [Vicingaceae bacterium]